MESTPWRQAAKVDDADRFGGSRRLPQKVGCGAARHHSRAVIRSGDDVLWSGCLGVEVVIRLLGFRERGRLDAIVRFEELRK